MISQVTAALAVHLASGGILLTALLAVRNALPTGFVRFCTGASAGLALVASALSPLGSLSQWLSLGLSAIALVYYARVRRSEESPRLSPTTILAASVSILVPAVSAFDTAAELPRLAAVGALSSTLLLGAVTVTMILGHWYLVDTSLSITPLRDGARWVSLAVVARWAMVGAALFLGGWETLGVHRAADLILETNGLFFLFRSLMGLGAPLVIAGLIWQTVKIRSTQSATGLLYVALILVLFGELVSSFLRVATGYPL